jgi:hypothetical protein
MLATMLVPVLYAVQAQGREPPPPPQLLRVFVSARGSDSNPCTFAAPCITFNRAISAVHSDGEIDVLDPVEFSSISISKAVSVQGHGFASIAPANSVTGIDIKVGPSEKVNLNGLIIDGLLAGDTGIAFVSGRSLVIENSVVRNWVNSGIAIAPVTTPFPPSTNLVSINISNTLVADNGGHGIFIQPQASPPGGIQAEVLATFSRVEVDNNAQEGIGIFANLAGRITATVVDSVATNNGGNFYALGNPSCPDGCASMQVIRSTSTQGFGNNFGIRAEDQAKISVGQSSLVYFFTSGAWSVSGSGQVVSFGDNDALDPAPSGTIPKK